MTLQKYAALVEYDGALFRGFQVQAGGRTVQGDLEQALKDLTGAETRIRAASRTDSGVHASGQVVSFRVPERFERRTIVRGLNYYLANDIAVKGVCPIHNDFDVRRMAVGRHYRYTISNDETASPCTDRMALRVAPVLDVSAMRPAARLLVGIHDFAAFATSLDEPGSTVRQVYEARVLRRGNMIEFWIAANAFLRHQVRNTIGQLIQVGLGKSGMQAFGELVHRARQGVAGPAAAARGLCLVKVTYETPLPFAS